jgi:cyclophilin family peptidyl-prolyl cis-trans isomerase
VFGKVVAGMDVVDKIKACARGRAFRQRFTTPVVITSATLVK